MWGLFVKWISEKSSDKIISIVERLLSGSFILTLVFLAIAIYVNHLDNRILLIATIVTLTPVIIIILSFVFNPYSRILNYILEEKIDLEKYREIMRVLPQKARNEKIKKEYQQVSLLGESQYYYLTGDVKQSLELLEQIDLSRVSNRNRPVYNNQVDYYKFLNKIEKEDTIAFENISQSSQRLKAIFKIKNGRTSSYFDSWHPDWRLEKITKSYYQGLNHLNQNNTEAAKAYFTQIVDENPDLFYVREAKKYLEELS